VDALRLLDTAYAAVYVTVFGFLSSQTGRNADSPPPPAPWNWLGMLQVCSWKKAFSGTLPKLPAMLDFKHGSEIYRQLVLTAKSLRSKQQHLFANHFAV